MSDVKTTRLACILDLPGPKNSYRHMVSEREFYYRKGRLPESEAELDAWEGGSAEYARWRKKRAKGSADA